MVKVNVFIGESMKKCRFAMFFQWTDGIDGASVHVIRS